MPRTHGPTPARAATAFVLLLHVLPLATRAQQLSSPTEGQFIDSFSGSGQIPFQYRPSSASGVDSINVQVVAPRGDRNETYTLANGLQTYDTVFAPSAGFCGDVTLEVFENGPGINSSLPTVSRALSVTCSPIQAVQLARRQDGQGAGPSGILNTPSDGQQYESGNDSISISYTPVTEGGTTFGIDGILAGQAGNFTLFNGLFHPNTTDNIVANFATPGEACGEFELVITEHQIFQQGAIAFRAAAPSVSITCATNQTTNGTDATNTTAVVPVTTSLVNSSTTQAVLPTANATATATATANTTSTLANVTTSTSVFNASSTFPVPIPITTSFTSPTSIPTTSNTTTITTTTLVNVTSTATATATPTNATSSDSSSVLSTSTVSNVTSTTATDSTPTGSGETVVTVTRTTSISNNPTTVTSSFTTTVTTLPDSSTSTSTSTSDSSSDTSSTTTSTTSTSSDTTTTEGSSTSTSTSTSSTSTSTRTTTTTTTTSSNSNNNNGGGTQIITVTVGESTTTTPTPSQTSSGPSSSRTRSTTSITSTYTTTEVVVVTASSNAQKISSTSTRTATVLVISPSVVAIVTPTAAPTTQPGGTGFANFDARTGALTAILGALLVGTVQQLAL